MFCSISDWMGNLRILKIIEAYGLGVAVSLGLGVKLVELSASLDTHPPPQSQDEGCNIDYLLETLRSEDDSVKDVRVSDRFGGLLSSDCCSGCASTLGQTTLRICSAPTQSCHLSTVPHPPQGRQEAPKDR